MKCEWNALIGLLPTQIQTLIDHTHMSSAQELHLRVGQPLQIRHSDKTVQLAYRITVADLQHCINAATRYSPWTSATAASGYLTAPGGHRIGLCGEFTQGSGGLSRFTSLCIRIAKDYPGLAQKAAAIEGSILILGKPGSGKTTLLRDLIRQRSDHSNKTVAVVDERRELFPYAQNSYCFPTGTNTDILSGITKPEGIEMAIRNLGPATIALDEITAKKDCEALLSAGWCGIDILATAHAASVDDLFQRHIYRPIVQSRLFDTFIVLQEDKSWRTERINECLPN